MQRSDLTARARTLIVAWIAGTMLAIVGSLAGLAASQYAASQYAVSQKGREFTPADVTIKRGETVTIVNDDADLRHHAYIDSDKFSFDSGDQEPGSKTSIAFPVAGTFEVLCAIHPKMKLDVHVQ